VLDWEEEAEVEGATWEEGRLNLEESLSRALERPLSFSSVVFPLPLLAVVEFSPVRERVREREEVKFITELPNPPRPEERRDWLELDCGRECARSMFIPVFPVGFEGKEAGGLELEEGLEGELEEDCRACLSSFWISALAFISFELVDEERKRDGGEIGNGNGELLPPLERGLRSFALTGVVVPVVDVGDDTTSTAADDELFEFEELPLD
jgi:hypothetical protein